LKEQQQKGNKKKQIDSNQEHIQKKMSTLNDDVIKKNRWDKGGRMQTSIKDHNKQQQKKMKRWGMEGRGKK